MRMAVNLSPRQFADEDLIADIGAALAKSGMAPDLLELEITESMMMHNVQQALELARRMKAMGVRLAVDDFGTGYSSMSLIKQFPIDTIKVDESFVRDIGCDADDRAITEAIIALGKALDLSIFAEGVESREQEAFLRERACDEIQGYLFSRPIPSDDFAAFVAGHSLSQLKAQAERARRPRRRRVVKTA
jgi:EAL domain-containing protein (putative c-di-GMP-specific phosphodiesterase class I)